MWTIVTIAWRNLWRQGRRTLITAVAMGIGVAMSLAMYAFSDGMMRMMYTVVVDQQLGHVQVHHPDYPARKALHDTISGAGARLVALDELKPRAMTGRLFGFGLVSAGEQTEGGQVVGVVPSREAGFGVVDDRVVSGRYLEDGKTGEAVIGAGLAKKLGVEVGGEIVLVTQAADGSLGNALFAVVGVFRSGDSMLDRGGVQVNLADLQEVLVLPDALHEILLLSHDEEQVDPLSAQVRGALADEGLLVQTWGEASPMTWQMMQSVDAQMGISIFIVLALASLGVLNTMLMAVFERTRELGVLMAVGMRPRQVVGLVVAESVLLGALASAAGAVMGAGLIWYLVNHGISFAVDDDKGLDFMGVAFDSVVKGRFRPERLVTVIGLVMAVSVVAALWPAWRAARLQPVDAIRDH
jgi:putative ABC transport system permease protein